MVDATINMVMERLVPIIEERTPYEEDLVVNAKTFASQLNNIKPLLNQAERKRSKDLRVAAWLKEIVEVLYKMGEALDELEMMQLNGRHQIGGSQKVVPPSGFWEKVSTSFVQSLCTRPKQAVEIHAAARKMEQLNEKLESIAKENDRQFRFLLNVSEYSPGSKPDLHAPYVDVSKVRGRENEKEDLVSKLLSSPNLEIISIVGYSGLGKTTLAQLAYNDARVKEHFQVKVWIDVPDFFDEFKIVKAIIESVEGGRPNVEGFLGIATLIKRIRFLLVLDDVNTLTDWFKWAILEFSLSKGRPGSKVLVTTRNHMVPKNMRTTHLLSLEPLTDSDCWSLVRQIAFQGMRKEDPHRQETIGKELVKRCKGLPIAAVILGSLLQKKITVQEWKSVMENEIWELQNSELGPACFPLLFLCYGELSPLVKQCFLYCAIVPKASDINADKLIRMWMAQGFLSSGSVEEKESKGRECFEELVANFFFQDTAVKNTIYAHEVIHDFVQHLAKSECLSLKASDIYTYTASQMKGVRHINWKNEEHSSISPTSLCSVEKLRSFLCHGKLAPDVLRNLRCVRVLSLDESDLEGLPSDIGNFLIHLRYLRLIGEHRIRKLPSSLCDLYYLETLDITGCVNLKELPEEIYKLKNLRHLFVPLLPPRVEQVITGLATLCYPKSEAHELALWLNFKRPSRLMDGSTAPIPPPRLYHLCIWRCVGFPQWMGSLNNLKSLKMYWCSTLPPFLWNLPSIEELQIWFVESLKCLDSYKFLGISTDNMNIKKSTFLAFPKLKRLEFHECWEWTDWEDITTLTEEGGKKIKIMPCLEELHIQFCPKLKSLPRGLLGNTPLQRLNISESYLLIKRYKSSEEEEGGGGELDKFFLPNCQVVDEESEFVPL